MMPDKLPNTKIKEKFAPNKIQDISIFDEDGKKKSQVTLLIEIGAQGQFLRDESGDAFIEINCEGVKNTVPVRSRDMREFLSQKLYNITEKGANGPAISDAIATLEAKAKFTGLMVTVCIRSHHSNGFVFIDMGDDSRKVIKVTKEGWNYSNTQEIKFVKKRGMTALPKPCGSGGGLDLLKKYVNISVNDLPLLIGWILCALSGVKPYPVLVLQGEQGTGKSTTCRVIRSLVDPSSVPLRSPPKNIKDLLVSAMNNHVVVLDNISGLNAELSDCLCRFSTGGGIDFRALYTDSEQNLINIQRPVLINGIDDIATRPDLLERALIINLPVIKPNSRRSEGEFWLDFERDKPLIFKDLLSCIASGLRHCDQVILKEKPRMADVAQWVTACERGMGIEGDFINAHHSNQLQAVESGIESSPVGAAISSLMSGCVKWTGKPTELMAALFDIAGDWQTKSRSWPQSPKGLKNAITRLTPNFRKIGIDIFSGKDGSGNRYYTLESSSLQVPYVPYVPYATDDVGLKHGTCTAHRKVTAVTESMCRTPNPGVAGDTAHTAVTALKNQEFIKTDDGEEF